jgi:uncharacterized membrane protein YoaK (UPF0700 family)
MAASPYGRETLAESVLAFTAGFVDTCGFIALFGLFTAHVTGNFVLIGATAAGQGHGLVAKLMALPVFVAVVAIVHATTRRSAASSARPLLVVQAALLGAFAILGMAASPIRSSDEPLAFLAGMTGVAAMAVQNAASRRAFAALAPTTVMTGNVTQLTIDLVDLAAGVESDARPALLARIRKTWPPILLFALGSASGAASVLAVGFSCLAAPLLALLGLAAFARGKAS